LRPLADNLISVLNSHEWLSRSELEVINSEGRTIPIGISTSILSDDDFGIRGVIAIFQDLTEAKRLEEKVRQADRMAAIGELSACIAHEIRNPLASISGSVEVLKKDLAVTGDSHKLLSLIIKESTRLNNILTDFLLYARVRRSRFNKVELNRIVSDVIELIRRHQSYHDKIKIEIMTQNHVAYISGDEEQLRQLLLNVGVNACEALGNSAGNIQFEIRSEKVADNELVWIAVRDDGAGIPEDQLDKIFLPFHSTKKAGTGLGLSIVARLVEALDGKIEVYSKPGQGTEFRLYFRGIGRGGSVYSESSALPVTLSL
jgi:two-component system sensor histidine kinase PilS (NtrC family)